MTDQQEPRSMLDLAHEAIVSLTAVRPPTGSQSDVAATSLRARGASMRAIACAAVSIAESLHTMAACAMEERAMGRYFFEQNEGNFEETFDAHRYLRDVLDTRPL